MTTYQFTIYVRLEFDDADLARLQWLADRAECTIEDLLTDSPSLWADRLNLHDCDIEVEEVTDDGNGGDHG